MPRFERNKQNILGVSKITLIIVLFEAPFRKSITVVQKVKQVIGDFNPSIVSSEIPYSEKGGSKVSTLVWQTDARVLHHSFRLDLISHSSKKHQVRD